MRRRRPRPTRRGRWRRPGRWTGRRRRCGRRTRDRRSHRRRSCAGFSWHPTQPRIPSPIQDLTTDFVVREDHDHAEPHQRAAPALDDVSKRIVELLQEDGRQPFVTIAREVGLSEAAVRQRVQKLIDGDVMQIVAVTDPLQVGFTRQAMVGVRVPGDVREVADALCAMPEVSYVVTTAGSFDLLVEVVCEDDEHLLDVVMRQIRGPARRRRHRDVRLPQAQQAAVPMGNPVGDRQEKHDHDARHLQRADRPDAYAVRLDVRGRRPQPPLGALHPPVRLGDGGIRAARSSSAARVTGSGTTAARSTSTGWPASSSSRSGTAGRSWPRRPPSRRRSSPSSRSGRMRTRAPSSSPSVSRPARPVTSTASSSPPGAARRSRPRGSWPSSSSS